MNNEGQCKSQNTIYGTILAIIVFVTVISQIPFFVIRGLSSPISMAAWGVGIVSCFLVRRGDIVLRRVRMPIGLALVFFFFYMLLGLLDETYWKSHIPRYLGLSIGILIIGNMSGGVLTKNDFKRILSAYIVATLIMSLTVYQTYYLGLVSFGTRNYLYDEKNSTALILVSAMIIITTTRLESSKLLKLVYIVADVFLAVLVLLMRSRAVYVGVGFSLLILLRSRELGAKLKWFLFAAILAITAYLVMNPDKLGELLDVYVFAGRSATNLNDLSSGRAIEWQNFWSDLGDDWLLGHGRMKRETLVLTSILEFGFPLGCLLIYLGFYPLLFGLWNFRRVSKERILYMTIAVCYVSNLFFEQLAPFGPGAKCFLLWLLIGIFAARTPNMERLIE